MGWKENAIMYWQDGANWRKISDHNRSPLDISYERFGTDNRMVDSTLRRYTVNKKRTFVLSWEMFPSKSNAGIGTADGGWAGEDIEAFYYATNGAFQIKLRKGADEAKAITDGTIEVVKVMITEFDKTVEKRGVSVDLWSLSITLEEV